GRLGPGEKLDRPLAFTPDGRVLAAGVAHPPSDTVPPRKTCKILLWELATGQELTTLVVPRATLAAFTPDGGRLATAYGVTYRSSLGGPELHLWDVATGRELRRWQGYDGHVLSLAFSPQGDRLATGLTDSTTLVWDVGDTRRTEAAGQDLRPANLDRLWEDLASTNAAQAFRAVNSLVALPGAGPFLSQRLAPAVAADASQVRRLIADLDSPQFADRQRAMAELTKLGDQAEPELRKALESKPTPEVRRRAERLLAGGPLLVRSAETLRRL